MAVTELDVRKIAELARLSLPDAEVPVIAAQLNSILSHMDALAQVDTSAVEPIAGIGADGTPLRGDAVAPAPMAGTAPMLAPSSRDGFLLVPRLATHEEL
ncbi:MAG: Asp-tRNA(Asn)/Glu-tRNA(Gln) amidotransferase subunit GatC [Gemmatimonadota bacterium]|nr:Asp-tRNA(Asn)/Glu-tRNA(Gln) amidotransferase subunit GatC [Gemmatimonadota bacterium]